MTKQGERAVEHAEQKAGGEGVTRIERLIDGKALGDHCRLFARVTLEPHSSIGYHEHHGESEAYYILSGQGRYDDNGIPAAVGPGDVTHTPSGHGHGIANTGKVPLEFIALILADD